jgi:hypothetical protein
MGANIAGIYGAQIFRQDDRPKYRRGFSINIAVLAVGLSLAVARFIDDLFRRRRAKRVTSDDGSDQGHHYEDGTKETLPSDVQPQPILLGGDVKPAVSDAVR